MQNFDWSAILRRLDGDRELLFELVDLFTDESPRLMAQISNSVTQQDTETLRLAAHGLRGVMAIFGDDTACHITRQLDAIARQGKLPQNGTLCTHLCADLKARVRRLRQHIDQQMAAETEWEWAPQLTDINLRKLSKSMSGLKPHKANVILMGDETKTELQRVR